MRRAFLISALFPLLVGCSILTPGSDAVIVNAERTERVAFHSVDAFLSIEKDNAATLKTVSPEIHKYAETLRHNAPSWFRSARALTETYKSNRSVQNKANLQSALALLETAQSQANDYMGRINTASP
jgi:hypothetical protein